MADHRFVYTVSGVDLSEGQQRKISQAIAAAVTGAIIGGSGEELRSEFFTLNRINGGKAFSAEAAKPGVIQELLLKPEGCQ